MQELQAVNQELAEARQAAEAQAAALQAECVHAKGQVESLRAQMHHARDAPDLQRQFKEVQAWLALSLAFSAHVMRARSGLRYKCQWKSLMPCNCMHQPLHQCRSSRVPTDQRHFHPFVRCMQMES